MAIPIAIVNDDDNNKPRGMLVTNTCDIAISFFPIEYSTGKAKLVNFGWTNVRPQQTFALIEPCELSQKLTGLSEKHVLMTPAFAVLASTRVTKTISMVTSGITGSNSATWWEKTAEGKKHKSNASKARIEYTKTKKVDGYIALMPSAFGSSVPCMFWISNYDIYEFESSTTA